MSSTIVVSHYNEDLSWLDNIDRNIYNVEVFSKTDIKYNFLNKNLGNEASSYLEYIIKFYDKLPEHNFFVHGHDTSYHQTISNQDFFKRVKIPPKYDYFNFNRRDYYVKDIKADFNESYITLINNWPFNKFKITEQFSFYSCAQFYVNKKLILQHPKELYQEMLNWLYTTKLITFWSSRLFEYTWCLIFTNSTSEPIISYDDILL